MQGTQKKMKHSNSMEENTHPDDTDSNTPEPQQPVTKEPATNSCLISCYFVICL